MEATGEYHTSAPLPPERNHGTFWIGGYLGPGVRLDFDRSEKFLASTGIRIPGHMQGRGQVPPFYIQAVSTSPHSSLPPVFSFQSKASFERTSLWLYWGPDVIPMDRCPDVIPMDRCPDFIPMDRCPDVIPMDRCPDVIPMDRCPDVIPMDRCPDVIPMDRCPDVIPMDRCPHRPRRCTLSPPTTTPYSPPVIWQICSHKLVIGIW